MGSRVFSYGAGEQRQAGAGVEGLRCRGVQRVAILFLPAVVGTQGGGAVRTLQDSNEERRVM